MSRSRANPEITRRQFVRRSVAGLGGIALGASAWASARAAQKAEGNAFAYDVERFRKTDPQLVRYEVSARFACPDPQPRRIAVGPDDKLYVAGQKGVTVLNAAGSVVNEFPTAEPARCIAVAANGAIYAGLRQRVEVLDLKGAKVGMFETPGKKSWFTGLCVGEPGLFVADAGERAVLHFDKSGKLAGKLGVKNKDKNVDGLIVPSPYLDVKLGKDGLLRVNNPGRHRVEVYTVDGELELAWGKPTAAIEGFCGCCNPIGLTLLPDGSCVTCEKGLPRVKVYSGTGAFECVVAGTELFPENAKASTARDLSDGTMGGLDAAIDSQGRVHVLDLVARQVLVLKRKAQA